MDPTVRKWQATIIADCEQILGRRPQAAERLFITSREGIVALEMTHDHVKSLAGRPEALRRYLNSEAREGH